MALIADRVHEETQSIDARTSLLTNALKHFTSSYLANTDIHSVASDYDSETRKVILASYFKAIAVLESRKVENIPRGPTSALFTAASKKEASVYALFGGQGTNEVYFDELQSLYDIYRPYVHEFIAKTTSDILLPLSAEEADNHYPLGLDVASWLSGAVERPSVAYLASIPVSFPLIGLTQLIQYLIACRVMNFTPAEMRERISGATGHSQGIVSAVVISASSTFESFFENSCKALKWLFYSGLRGQQAFPVVSLEPSLVSDAVENGEGIPSPMLSVTGLSLKDLEPHIKKTNTHLPVNSQLHISLHNGPKAHVVTGPSRALYGLVTNLRKIRAPSGTDQSKVPYSQRKAAFSVRFLVVAVPYHNSDYLSGVTDTLLAEDLDDEELWKPSDLHIPVFNTEDGKSSLRLLIFQSTLR